MQDQIQRALLVHAINSATPIFSVSCDNPFSHVCFIDTVIDLYSANGCYTAKLFSTLSDISHFRMEMIEKSPSINFYCE